jgi:enamine deaminase RidA (YjgF/YER057c/UK114 family)
MPIERIQSGGEFESKVGYCRAVVAGGWVHVSGTVGQADGVEAQCASALDIIGTALEKAGAGFADVVRVTYMLPRASDFKLCWPILRDAFGENPPAATMIECGLIDSVFLIDIEVTALLPE